MLLAKLALSRIAARTTPVLVEAGKKAQEDLARCYTVTVSRRISRFIALALLLWTAVDLSIPSICRAEDSSWNLGQNTGIAQRHEGQVSQAPGFQGDDDCFCCCSHIVPSSHFAVNAEARVVSSTTVPRSHQIDQDPRSLFHPPKS